MNNCSSWTASLVLLGYDGRWYLDWQQLTRCRLDHQLNAVQLVSSFTGRRHAAVMTTSIHVGPALGGWFVIQEGAALRGRPLWGHPCSIFTMGISFSVRVKAHVPKTIRKKVGTGQMDRRTDKMDT